MKNFFKILADLIDSWAKARAATALTRMGKIEEAKNVYR